MQTIIENKITIPNNQISAHCFNCGNLIVRDPFTDEKGRTFCDKDCKINYHKRLLITLKIDQISIFLEKYSEILLKKINDKRIHEFTKNGYKKDVKLIRDLLLDFTSISVFEYSAENLLLKDNYVKRLEEINQSKKLDIERLRKQRDSLSSELQKIRNEDYKQRNLEKLVDKDFKEKAEELFSGEDFFVNEIKELLLAETMTMEQLDDIANSVEELRKKQSQGMSHLEIQKQMINSKKANLQQWRDN